MSKHSPDTTLEESTWEASTDLPRFETLTEDTNADVAIIGGGLTGVLAAYLLAKDGRDVVLVEQGRIASGATGVTTGFLTQNIDTDFHDLLTVLKEDQARMVVDSHGSAIDLVETIVKEERIDCEFMRTSNSLYINERSDRDWLDKEYTAAKELGLKVKLHEEPLPGFANHGCLELTSQAKFHPLKFLAGVAKAAATYGARLYEETEGEEIITRPERGIRLRNGKTITAPWILSATYEPFKDPLALHFKKGMYSSYVEEYSIPAGALPEGLYEDDANPYHYFRVDAGKGGDRLIIGGEDHRQDLPVDASKNFQALEDYIGAHFGSLDRTLVHKWQGPILEPVDGVAYIGPHTDPQTFYAFGFSGSGMTYAPIAAMMMRDAVRGTKNPWAGLYAADRFPRPLSFAVKAIDYFGEIAGGAIKNSLKYKKDE